MTPQIELNKITEMVRQEIELIWDKLRRQDKAGTCDGSGGRAKGGGAIIEWEQCEGKRDVNWYNIDKT